MLGDGESPLVSAAWLAKNLRDPSVRVVDARWYLDGRSGSDAHAAGHIPTAVHLDIDRDLAAPPARDGVGGRHPLPSPAAFADTIARVGIGPDTWVVAYDDDGGSKAARLWWMLQYFGHGRGKVLDGGIQAWVAAGGSLEKGPVRPARQPPMELVSIPRLVLGRERVQTLVEEGNGVLIDARVAPRYEGVSEPVDARPGHIPRAVNVPYTDNLVAPGGVFRDVASLRARYRAAGVQIGSRVAVYCGSGVTACHDILALGLIGIEGQLYDGSYSDWLSDPELDVNTGREPLPPSRGRWFFGGFRRGAARSSSGG